MADGHSIARASDAQGKCGECGAPTDKFVSSGRFRKFCSKLCAQRTAKRIQRRKHPKPAPIARRAICSICETAFAQVRPAHGGKTPIYCSHACATKATQRKPAQFCTVHFLRCRECDRCFASRRRRTTCSEACNRARAAKKSLLLQRARVMHYEGRTCDYCGIRFTAIWRCYARNGKRANRRFCSPQCGARFFRAASGRNHRARARRRGAAYERVDRFAVFERDGWRCQLCGIDTPPSLFRKKRGDNTMNAPELDHIVPLARGGDHVMDNCQCLCRACNGLKGAMTMEEARQVRATDLARCIDGSQSRKRRPRDARIYCIAAPAQTAPVLFSS
jgi:hypothetical protein